MLPPELANPFKRPPAIPLNPDTAGMVEDMLGKKAREAFEALDDEPKKPKEKPQELTEQEKAAMREAQKRLERSRERFPTWKSIPLGEYKTVEELISALEKKGFQIGIRAREMLKKTPLSGFPSSVELVKVPVEELGLEGQVTIQEVYDRAKGLGFSLCPAEVGPALRLHYSDQPMNERLFVAMEPVADPGIDFNVFSVGHDVGGGGLWLHAGFGRPDDVVGTDDYWIFLCSKKK